MPYNEIYKHVDTNAAARSGKDQSCQTIISQDAYITPLLRLCNRHCTRVRSRYLIVVEIVGCHDACIYKSQAKPTNYLVTEDQAA